MIYVTGDIHSDLERFYAPEMKRLRKKDTLIICGDFGFIWDGSEKEKKLIKSLTHFNFTIAFVDGAHENFDVLNSYEAVQWNGGKVHQIAKNVFHLMRGQIFTIDGTKIFTFGGGESLDRDARIEHESWWREELPSNQELLDGVNNIENAAYKVDLIITHEPPAKTKGFLMLQSGPERTSRLNSYLEELASVCEYKRWYFGNLHVDKYVTANQIAVFREVHAVDFGENKKR